MSETPLGRKLKALIAANGPISVADYMAQCLGDPQHGYYMTRDPLGAAGDFTTAPEISQMFGEIVGAWLAHVWSLAGSPSPVRLVELGPGRGTLMADILRTLRLTPGLLLGTSVHLLETSPVLRTRQKAALSGVDVSISWHGNVAEVPDGFLLLVANEFLDALPIRQFVRQDGEWRERVVGLGADGALCFGIGPGRLADAPAATDGTILEISPPRQSLVQALAARLARTGGVALFIDYGHAQSGTGDSLQAVRSHSFADVLGAPGDCDLTSHVDFAALARAAAAEGASIHGPVSQGEFLLKLGISERAERLAAGKDESTRKAVGDDLQRLTSPEQMGSLFKILAITQPGIAPPPFAQ